MRKSISRRGQTAEFNLDLRNKGSTIGRVYVKKEGFI